MEKKNPGLIKLDTPVEVQGQKYSSLTMRRCKVRDQKAAEKSAVLEADIETLLFANLCDVPPEVIDELDMFDYKKVQEEYGFFMTTAPGKTPGTPAS